MQPRMVQCSIPFDEAWTEEKADNRDCPLLNAEYGRCKLGFCIENDAKKHRYISRDCQLKTIAYDVEDNPYSFSPTEIKE